MKTTQKLKYVLMGLLLSFICVSTSCQKEKTKPDKKPNFKAIEDNAIAERIFGDVFNQSGKASKDAEAETGGKGGDIIFSGCPTLTISPFDLTWPKNITVDFGPTNCLGNDGHNRRGIIHIHATGTWRTPGSVTTVTFSNYYHDEHKVEGTKIITNNGRNADSNFVYTIDVQNAKITKPDNTFLTWASLRQNEWIEGESTILNPFDDAYLVTGNITGVSSGGENYTIDILTALNVHMSCQWIRAGVLEIKIDNISPIQVDYGTGACDPYADVLYEGVTYPIVMQ